MIILLAIEVRTIIVTVIVIVVIRIIIALSHYPMYGRTQVDQQPEALHWVLPPPSNSLY